MSKKLTLDELISAAAEQQRIIAHNEKQLDRNKVERARLDKERDDAKRRLDAMKIAIKAGGAYVDPVLPPAPANNPA
jgi:hypothetical protein